MHSSVPEFQSPVAAETNATSSDSLKSTPAVGALFITVYALALFGIWMAINLPASVTLALRISEIDPLNKTTSYSLIAGIGTLVALVANPFFGRLSDRTRSRFGRRRPWIAIGLAGTIVGASIIGLSNTIPLMIVGWVLMQGFVNAAIAALLAIVADHVPERQQGLVGALSGTASAASLVVGIFFIQAFPTSILAQIGLPVLIAVLFCGVLLALYKKDSPASGDLPHFGVKEFLGTFFIDPRKSPDFSWFLAAIFFIALGAAVVATYSVYYLQDQLAVPEAELTNVLFFALLFTGLASLVSAPLGGWVSDRIGRRKPILVAAAVSVAVGIGLIVTAQEWIQFLIGQAVAGGVSAGLLFGVYITFAIAVQKDTTHIARDLGLVNIAVTLPFSLVPFLAPLVLGIGSGQPNYVLLYIVGAALSLVSVPLLFRIQATR